MGNTLGDILAHAMKENENHGEEPKMIKSTNNVHVMHFLLNGKGNINVPLFSLSKKNKK